MAVCVLVGCAGNGYNPALRVVDSLINERPDSAMFLLDSMKTEVDGWHRSERMRYRLLRLNTLNKLDTVFYSTTEAQTLADYFDDHGTPNEQMLAHYLLGRAYYDIHEAPMALHCFQEAADRADTTASDCDYRQLSRVYGQMAGLFYHQNLMTQSLRCDDKSIEYALKGKDTLNAILSMSGQFFSYSDLHQTDSAIYIGEFASELALKHGYKTTSAAVLGGIIRLLINKGELKKAKHYMDRYEQESGFFDSSHCIERGREMYYNIKAFYFLSVEKFDSAEYFFRKELREGKDFNNQNAGSRGLALLFQKIHQPDSAAKYALYSYAMNDSVYAQMATHEVEQMRGMYDYSRNQNIAREEMNKRQKIESRNRIIVNITIALLLCITSTLYYIKQERKKRKEEHAQYNENLSKLAKAQDELNKLRSLREDIEQLDAHILDMNLLIKSKEEEVVRLNKDVEAYKEKIRIQKISADAKLEEYSTYKKLKKTAARADVIEPEAWQEIKVMVRQVLPNFFQLISSNMHKLNDKEFKTCILIRLHFIPKEVASMLGLSQPSITKIRNNLMTKLFDEEGNSKELDKRLKDYS